MKGCDDVVVEERKSSRSFEEVSQVHPVGPGRFEALVDPDWTIGGKPNGGYLLAMMGRAATWAVAHDHVIAASAQYVSSPEPGSVQIATEILRQGRTATQVRARLGQAGRTRIEALFTASHLEMDSEAYWQNDLPKVITAKFEDCERLVPVLPDGKTVAIMEQVEVRLDPESRPFARGEPTGRGQLGGWLAIPGIEAFDPTSLLFAVDSFPPATFDVEFSGWVPTFELTAYVRALPAPGPVRVLQTAHLIQAQRVDEACFVWDSAGRLVAQATQLAGVRLGSV